MQRISEVKLQASSRPILDAMNHIIAAKAAASSAKKNEQLRYARFFLLFTL